MVRPSRKRKERATTVHTIEETSRTSEHPFPLETDEETLEGRRNTMLVSTEEMREVVSSSRHVVNVIVLPPTAGDAGDEASDVEIAADDPDEMFELAGELVIEEEIDEEGEPAQKFRMAKHRRLSKWKKSENFDKNFDIMSIPLNEHLHGLSGLSPFEIWKKFISDDIVKHIMDIRNFLGLLLLSGYHCLPEARHYWSTQPDLAVDAASRTMSRDRFHQLKRFLHLADNQNLSAGDKMSKISPLYQMLNDRLVQYGVFHESLSIDESMVPYYGRHSAKMFIRGKPIHVGYKIWMLCGTDGYPYQLNIYQGKEPAAE
ncbi:PiggyBac transposable element-derived protein 3 [Trichinella papuae]|uniref:PiggyBac transposable element-derived protein 3 n=1 Tax=Trichinella papuae TaxID=268474 RepID=A0A0V1M2I2_9BILA|nr:PiggyBac transposable element-derived protein 3 [Trichinella papuae]KRZ65985.1 PiggyBac transposable element-derived protein 3 [Trichinella papuae]